MHRCCVYSSYHPSKHAFFENPQNCCHLGALQFGTVPARARVAGSMYTLDKDRCSLMVFSNCASSSRDEAWRMQRMANSLCADPPGKDRRRSTRGTGLSTPEHSNARAFLELASYTRGTVRRAPVSEALQRHAAVVCSPSPAQNSDSSGTSDLSASSFLLANLTRWSTSSIKSCTTQLAMVEGSQQPAVHNSFITWHRGSFGYA